MTTIVLPSIQQQFHPKALKAHLEEIFIKVSEPAAPKHYFHFDESSRLAWRQLESDGISVAAKDFIILSEKESFEEYKLTEDRGPAALSVPMCRRYVKDGDPMDETLNLYEGVPPPCGYPKQLTGSKEHQYHWNNDYQQALGMAPGYEREKTIQALVDRFAQVAAPFACYLIRVKLMKHYGSRKPSVVTTTTIDTNVNNKPAGKNGKARKKRIVVQKQQQAPDVPANEADFYEPRPQPRPFVATADKYLYQGIQFTFANTMPRISFFEGDHEAANKVFGEKMVGLQELVNVNEPKLRYPLCALIEYCGYRMWASAFIPIPEGSRTVVYGSLLSSQQFIKTDDECNTVVKRVAKQLNLKGHWACNPDAQEDDTRERYYFTNCDLRIHRAEDNRL
eukprot:PhF_6_TR2001/c0_g1_i2/m.3390